MHDSEFANNLVAILGMCPSNSAPAGSSPLLAAAHLTMASRGMLQFFEDWKNQQGEKSLRELYQDGGAGVRQVRLEAHEYERVVGFCYGTGVALNSMGILTRGRVYNDSNGALKRCTLCADFFFDDENEAGACRYTHQPTFPLEPCRIVWVVDSRCKRPSFPSLQVSPGGVDPTEAHPRAGPLYHAKVRVKVRRDRVYEEVHKVSAQIPRHDPQLRGYQVGHLATVGDLSVCLFVCSARRNHNERENQVETLQADRHRAKQRRI